jgi:hypothetical protein
MRIALLASNPLFNDHVQDLIQKIGSETGIELQHLILLNKAERSGKSGSLLQLWAFRLLLLIERIFLFRNRTVVENIVSLGDISNSFAFVTRLKFGDNISQEKLNAIKALNLDLIIKVGDEVEGMEQLADASRLGLVSTEYSADVHNESVLSGFWEVLYKLDTTNFSISRIHSNRTKEVLLQCNFQTRYCFLLNKAFLYKKAGVHLLGFVREVARTGSFPANKKMSQSLSKSRKLYDIGFSTYFRYVFQTLLIVLRKILRTLFYNGFRWHVVVYNKYVNNTLFSEPRIIANPPGRFLADPFLVSFNNQNYCFVEDADSKTKKGRISFFEVGTESISDIRVCLEEESHLSFPYIFKFKDDFYMCPETCASDQIRIYKATNFPLEWKLEKIIMQNIRAADSMLFEHEGRWWLFTNIDPSRIGDNSSELYLFYAESPLSTEWTPHKLNPIYIDSTKARNGGLILNGKEIFRIAQKQEFDKYGANVSIYRISALSTDVYKEDLQQTIESNYLPNILGTHHMSGTSDFTALDFYNVEREKIRH